MKRLSIAFASAALILATLAAPVAARTHPHRVVAHCIDYGFITLCWRTSGGSRG